MQIYCDKYDCNAVILRPDKYVFDIFNFETDNLDQIDASVIKSLEETALFTGNLLSYLLLGRLFFILRLFKIADERLIFASS